MSQSIKKDSGGTPSTRDSVPVGLSDAVCSVKLVPLFSVK
jgi:hypothetical protein